jgi:hypothetical protein
LEEREAEVFEDPEEELGPVDGKKLDGRRDVKGHDTCSKYYCFRNLSSIVFSSHHKTDLPDLVVFQARPARDVGVNK